MKRWQQFLSGYLALCVALAGAVGLNPALHRWVEHGGHGPSHSHMAQSRGTKAHGHGHPHGQSHSHDGSPDHHHEIEPEDEAFAPLFVESYKPPTLLGWQITDLYQAIANIWSQLQRKENREPVSDDEGHSHHSLAQLLLGGALAATSHSPPLICPQTVLPFPSQIPGIIFLSVDFDPQTSSRPPPLS